MSTPATNFKLGIFAIAALASFVVAMLALGLRTGRGKTVELHTLFDESVQGLETGAPVKYRGVKIGNVARVDVAPDRRHVDVALAIDARSSARLELQSSPAVVAELSTQGVTGVKFIDLDVDATTERGDARYLRSRPSLTKRLADQAVALADALPVLIDEARATLHRFDTLLDETRDRDVLAHTVAAIDEAHAAIGDLRRLAPHATRALDATTELAATANRTVTHADGAIDALRSANVAAGARRATDAVTSLARRLIESTTDLDHTIRDLGEAARTFRELVDEVARDPDMLVKGRAPARRP